MNRLPADQYQNYKNDTTKGGDNTICHTNGFGECRDVGMLVGLDDYVNAYDNALLATDDFLQQTINWLTTQTQADTAMLYLSDHGESLGEKGVYLHGMPKAFAPKEQLIVPALLWLPADSPFTATNQSASGFSHDAITPTLLNFFGVTTQATLGKTGFVTQPD